MRHENDFYETPHALTRALLAHLTANDICWTSSITIVEPCVGDGAIADVLRAECNVRLVTNDIDQRRSADWHMDAADPTFWRMLDRCDWVVTNPPFNAAAAILPHAVARARNGVAALLRITWLEPCQDRADFLTAHPPSCIMPINPRPRFCLGRNGRPATDSATVAWFVWDRHARFQKPVLPITNWRDCPTERL